jgi:hypothetical protein
MQTAGHANGVFGGAHRSSGHIASPFPPTPIPRNPGAHANRVEALSEMLDFRRCEVPALAGDLLQAQVFATKSLLQNYKYVKALVALLKDVLLPENVTHAFKLIPKLWSYNRTRLSQHQFEQCMSRLECQRLATSKRTDVDCGLPESEVREALRA